MLFQFVVPQQPFLNSLLEVLLSLSFQADHFKIIYKSSIETLEESVELFHLPVSESGCRRKSRKIRMGADPQPHQEGQDTPLRLQKPVATATTDMGQMLGTVWPL